MRHRRAIHWMQNSFREVFLCPCTRSCIVVLNEFQHCAIYVPQASQKECQLSRSTSLICSFQLKPPTHAPCLNRIVEGMELRTCQTDTRHISLMRRRWYDVDQPLLTETRTTRISWFLAVDDHHEGWCQPLPSKSIIDQTERERERKQTCTFRF